LATTVGGIIIYSTNYSTHRLEGTQMSRVNGLAELVGPSLEYLAVEQELAQDMTEVQVQ
jgi:hypothetical protein